MLQKSFQHPRMFVFNVHLFQCIFFLLQCKYSVPQEISETLISTSYTLVFLTTAKWDSWTGDMGTLRSNTPLFIYSHRSRVYVHSSVHPTEVISQGRHAQDVQHLTGHSERLHRGQPTAKDPAPPPPKALLTSSVFVDILKVTEKKMVMTCAYFFAIM